MYFTERNTLAPTRPYLFITVINLHIFCINYLPTFDLKTGKVKIERSYKDMLQRWNALHGMEKNPQNNTAKEPNAN